MTADRDYPGTNGDSPFHSAFDYATIGMALVAPNGTFLKVNRALCQITGYSAPELLQRTFQDITHRDDLNLDLANVRKILTGEISTYQMEKRYYRKNGAIVWVLLSVSLVRDTSDEPRFFISQIQDISEKKETEWRLEEATANVERLQEAMRKVSERTQPIEVDGQSITVEEFLREHLGLNINRNRPGEAASSSNEE